jgi:hypothetical protein
MGPAPLPIPLIGAGDRRSESQRVPDMRLFLGMGVPLATSRIWDGWFWTKRLAGEKCICVVRQ